MVMSAPAASTVGRRPTLTAALCTAASAAGAPGGASSRAHLHYEKGLIEFLNKRAEGMP